MPRLRTYGKWIAALAVLLILAQLGLPFLFRTQRMKDYLLRNLEKSFGRRVQARGFSMELLPFPRVDVEGVTIEENPAFGHEYFLRADRLTASVRWFGLLRGHFDFGTISLLRPSLILVRNEQGRWNLEGWLPPAPAKFALARTPYGPQSPADAANHLLKIEFDDGRINFKTGDEKRPFAFTGVSGSVEQMAPGRWQLQLEAQPWRSGVALQSTGTLQVRGEVAGTSARLQPAEIQVHWDKVSIADLFRMITGNDYGVRGEFALDANASVGKPESREPAPPGAWKFSAQARAARIHRWDLTERGDNPSFTLNLKGVWDVLAGEARAQSVVLDLQQSHFEGLASLTTSGMSEWQVHFEDAGIQGQDFLAWYRAFHPDVAESVSAKQFFKASFALHGQPLTWEGVEVSSNGGELRLPGFSKPVRVGKVRGFTSRQLFRVLPVQFFLDGVEKEAPAPAMAGKSNTAIATAALPQDRLELRFQRNLGGTDGTLEIAGKVSDAGNLLKATAGLGRTLNHGWELTGGAAGKLDLEWDHGMANGRWSGTLALDKAQLQAAGLNLPLKLEDVRATWNAGRRSATIFRADAFGAAWSGSIDELPVPDAAIAPHWAFQLHADRLDAADLDLWLGPRARPNWLQRLLASLLGNPDTNAKPSELLRRVSAEGNLEADSLTIEKLRLAHARAHVAFHDLHLEVTNAGAEWAGGNVRGDMSAVFSLPPNYEISALVDHANLSLLPWSAHWAERWGGTASGKIHLTTSGIGRDALMTNLDGGGELHLKAIELHGWDISASLDAGALRTGSSRWASGDGEFTIGDRAIHFESLGLENPRAKMKVTGGLNFSQELNLTFLSEGEEKRGAKPAAAPRLFELHGPLESPLATVIAAPLAQAKKQE